MADQYVTLNAEPRTLTGKRVSQLRLAGLTPIVVYGRSVESMALQVPTKELTRALRQAGGTQLIALQVAGEDKPRMTLARELQRHVTRLTPLHADLLEVAMDRIIETEIPVVLDGEPELVRVNEAGLQQEMQTIRVAALPADLPAAIHLDATRLENIGDSLTVADVRIEGEVEVLGDPDQTVALLTVLREVEVDEVPEEELLEGEEELLEGEEAEPEEEAEE